MTKQEKLFLVCKQRKGTTMVTNANNFFFFNSIYACTTWSHSIGIYLLISDGVNIYGFGCWYNRCTTTIIPICHFYVTSICFIVTLIGLLESWFLENDSVWEVSFKLRVMMKIENWSKWTLDKPKKKNYLAISLSGQVNYVFIKSNFSIWNSEIID